MLDKISDGNILVGKDVTLSRPASVRRCDTAFCDITHIHHVITACHCHRQFPVQELLDQLDYVVPAVVKRPDDTGRMHDDCIQPLIDSIQHGL